MPRDTVEIGRDVLERLIELADDECDSLHDLADSVEGEAAELEAYNDYRQRADAALELIIVARRILSEGA